MTSRKQLHSFYTHRKAATETVNSYYKQFQIGKRTLLDLLNSEDELFTAKTDYVNGTYDVLFSKYRILNSGGSLLSRMNIMVPFSV